MNMTRTDTGKVLSLSDYDRLGHHIEHPELPTKPKELQKGLRTTPTHPAAGDNPVIQVDPVPIEWSPPMLGWVLAVMLCGLLIGAGLFAGWRIWG